MILGGFLEDQTCGGGGEGSPALALEEERDNAANGGVGRGHEVGAGGAW